VFHDRDEAWSLAEPLDWPAVGALAAFTERYELAVVAGLCLRDGGLPCNAAALLGRGALRAVYVKTHLWAGEQDLFTSGDADPSVVDNRRRQDRDAGLL
jgi:predicted amidohydrolase